MPRYRRIVIADCPHHLTQSGNHGQTVFHTEEDREVYIRLIRRNAEKCGVHLLGYCLMPNHVHWIVVPQREDSLATAFGRTHYTYANYFQAKQGTTGHLWQNRFFSCPMSARHLTAAMTYVEQNPVRAGLVRTAMDYPWSSAGAHMEGQDARGILELREWSQIFPPAQWRERLSAAADAVLKEELERCTYTGRPFGEEEFRQEVAAKLGVDLTLRRRGRPSGKVATMAAGKMEKC